MCIWGLLIVCNDTKRLPVCVANILNQYKCGRITEFCALSDANLNLAVNISSTNWVYILINDTHWMHSIPFYVHRRCLTEDFDSFHFLCACVNCSIFCRCMHRITLISNRITLRKKIDSVAFSSSNLIISSFHQAHVACNWMAVRYWYRMLYYENSVSILYHSLRLASFFSVTQFICVRELI